MSNCCTVITIDVQYYISKYRIVTQSELNLRQSVRSYGINELAKRLMKSRRWANYTQNVKVEVTKCQHKPTVSSRGRKISEDESLLLALVMNDTFLPNENSNLKINL